MSSYEQWVHDTLKEYDTDIVCESPLELECYDEEDGTTVIGTARGALAEVVINCLTDRCTS